MDKYEKRQLYLQKNKERIAEVNKKYSLANDGKIREYRKKHKDKSKEYSKNYYQQNKEECNARNKRYYNCNKAKILNDAKKYKEEHKLQVIRWKRDSVLRKYNLTQEEYDNMLKEQNNCCALCSESFGTENPHIDHDHNTGEVRGLLHGICNRGLGCFKENKGKLSLAIKYLEKYE